MAQSYEVMVWTRQGLETNFVLKAHFYVLKLIKTFKLLTYYYVQPFYTGILKVKHF